MAMKNQVRLTDANHAAILEIVRQCSFPVSITTVANACVEHGLPQTRAMFRPTPAPSPPRRVQTTTALAKPLTATPSVRQNQP